MKTRKHNGLAIGTFLISIDDGFVEYQYKIRMRHDSYSIQDIYGAICATMGSRKFKGAIRPHTTKP